MFGHKRFFNGMRRKYLNLLPDKLYTQLFYREVYGCFPNLHDPKTFDEKLQWYKLYYRTPLMTTLTDKYEVRGYIKDKGFGGILNELYGVYHKFDDIDFSRLPERFVLKATHGSNMNILCKDKKSLDWETSRRLMNKWLRRNYYHLGREWAYKNIKPRLVCEKYLENEKVDELIDYKFYCYNSKPEVLFVCTGRFSAGGVTYNAYDMDWNRIYAYKGKPCSDLVVEKPDTFEEMTAIAGELSQGFPFTRVDLYSVQGKIIFGELTFYPDCGVIPFSPDNYNYFFGDLFILPDKRR